MVYEYEDGRIGGYFTRFEREWNDVCTFLKQFDNLGDIPIVPKKQKTKPRVRGRAIVMLSKDRKPLMQFDNAIDAAEFIHGNINSIRCKCGSHYTYKGYYWEYADNKEVSDVEED